jgi:signal transduction histidine kinase
MMWPTWLQAKPKVSPHNPLGRVAPSVATPTLFTDAKPESVLSSGSMQDKRDSASMRHLSRAAYGMQNEKLLVFIILVLLSCFLAALGGGMNLYYKNSLNRRYEQYGTMLGRIIEVEGHSIFLEPEPARQKQRFRSLGRGIIYTTPDIASLAFYDKQQALIYGVKQSNIPAKRWNRFKEYSIPVRAVEDGPVIGQVVYRLTGGQLRDILKASTPILVIPFASAWILTVFVIMVMTYIWMKQLELIVNAVQRLSKGEFGVCLPSVHFTGLQRQLADDINEMSRRLKIYEDHNIETILFERRKLETSLQSIVDGVVVCNHEDRVVLLNEAALRLLDIETREAALGRSVVDYQDDAGNRPFAEALKGFKASLETLASPSSDAPTNDATWYMAPYSHVVEMGPELALRVIVSPVRNSRSVFEPTEALSYVMIMHNITREVEVDKLKTNFISNVSHELRTPVTTIKSYVDTLYHHRHELDSETQDEFMETLNIETERLKKLVNDILDFSRLDEGQVELSKDWDDMTPILTLTLQSIKVLAKQKNITLSASIESNLPPVYMNSDSMERVMLNLLSNAIKYTPEGGHVRVRAELSANRENLNISVQDTGIGLSAEDLRRVFDRFYRVENKVHTVKGTGLGLHLVKVTIEKHHGGQVFAESVEGEGSIFGFTLPIHAEPSNAKGGVSSLPAHTSMEITP